MVDFIRLRNDAASHLRPLAPGSQYERGIALVMVLILLAVAFLMIIAFLEFYRSTLLIMRRNQQIINNLDMAYESVNMLLRKQNDDNNYIFTQANYDKSSMKDAKLKTMFLNDGENKAIGKIEITLSPNPLNAYSPEYNLNIMITQYPSQMQTEAHAVISPVHLSDYQYYSMNEIDVFTSMFSGKIYSPLIRILRNGVHFWNSVEYGSIENEKRGIFHYLKNKIISPFPSLGSTVQFERLKLATQTGSSVCGPGIGVYIGPEGSLEYQQLISTLFMRKDDIYQIDLTRFKCRNNDGFVEYNGVDLPRYDHTHSAFNGIIYVEGEAHVWGILGGRSHEDHFIIDKEENPDPKDYYAGPDGAGNNSYSNNTLDEFEDMNNNGYLDVPEGSCNLIIVTKPGSSLYIDHNIFQPAYPNWENHKLLLISGGTMHLSASSPKTTVIEASLLAIGKHSELSFIVDWGSPGNDRIDNYWAKTSNGNYQYDINADGKLSWDNGEGQPEDRDEYNMKKAHALILRGNLLLRGKSDFGEYVNNGHILKLIYDEKLSRSHQECSPFLPVWKAVKGSIKLLPDD